MSDITFLSTSGIGDNCVVIMANGIRAASEFHNLFTNRTEFGVYTLTLTGGHNIFCPIGQLMRTSGRHNSCGTTTACRGFFRSLNVLTIYTFVIENVVTLVTEEHVQDLLNEDLQPPLGGRLLLVVMRRHGCLFNHTVTAMLAYKQDLAMLRASGALGHIANVIMAMCRNDLAILMTAYGTSVANLAILGASGSGLGGGIVMANSLNLIGGVPLAADQTDMLIVTPLGAGGIYPNGCSIVVSITVMNAIQYECMVSTDRHAFGVTRPTVGGIPLLFLNCRSNDLSTVRQNHFGDQGLSVRIKEADGVLAGAGLNNGFCHDVHGRSGWNGVGHTVAVDIPTNQHLRFLEPLGKLQIRLTDDLRGRENLAAHEVSVLIVEIRRDPFVAVNHLVAVVPTGVVFIPADIFFVGFDIDGDAGDAVEGASIHTNIFSENDGF